MDFIYIAKPFNTDGVSSDQELSDLIMELLSRGVDVYALQSRFASKNTFPLQYIYLANVNAARLEAEHPFEQMRQRRWTIKTIEKKEFDDEMNNRRTTMLVEIDGDWLREYRVSVWTREKKKIEREIREQTKYLTRIDNLLNSII